MTQRNLTEKELEKRAEILARDVEKYGIEEVVSWIEKPIMTTLLNAFAVIEAAQDKGN
jgi:hypothetical protein